MRVPPIRPNDRHCHDHLDHCHDLVGFGCHDLVGHDCHGLVQRCCDERRDDCRCDHGDYWLCRWPIPRNTSWEGKPASVRHIPANWAGGIGSTGENMSLATAGVTNVDVYTRQNHTWHTGTVLAHMFSLARELQKIHHGLHHLRVGSLDRLQQLPPVPMADTGPGAVLDVRV